MLWYHNLDYGAFLRQQLVAPTNNERCKAYLHEYGLVQLLKSTCMQMARSVSTLLSFIPTIAQKMSEYHNFNPIEMERLKKMLSEKEVAMVERAEEVERWVKKQADTEETPKVVTEQLLQKEQEIEAEREKMRAEVIELEDANYANFESGFDQAVAQVKYFNKNVSVDFSLVDREKSLDEILGQRFDANLGGQSPPVDP